MARKTAWPGWQHIGDHRAKRKWWKPFVDSGQCPCARCGRLIEAGTPWHLDHADGGHGWIGPSHASCNMRAGGRLGNARMRANAALEQAPRPRFRPSREW